MRLISLFFKHFRRIHEVLRGGYLYPFVRKYGLKGDAERLRGGNNGLRQAEFKASRLLRDKRRREEPRVEHGQISARDAPLLALVSFDYLRYEAVVSHFD